MISYEACIAQYEAEARKLADLAADYREKEKEATRLSDKLELRERANMYEELSIEKRVEARNLRERL